MFKPFLCLLVLLVFSISVMPVIQIISFLHQEEMVDDLNGEDVSLIKIGGKVELQLHNFHDNALISKELFQKHYHEEEDINTRLFNDVISPPPDEYNFLG
jgi:hypothetical protein